MKTKKINLNWQSVLLGMALCLVLVVFLGSKVANTQITDPQPRTLQRAANVTDVWDRTVALEDRLIRMEKKIDGLVESLQQVSNNVHWMYKNQQQAKKK